MINEFIKTSKTQIKTVLLIITVFSSIEIINACLSRALVPYGLIPRDFGGLIGIVTAPFIHGSFTHFLSNIPPVIIFSFLLLQHGIKEFWIVTAISIFLSGLLVWISGRNNIHIGASGLVYGYFGYLLVAGWLSKEVKALIISIVVVIMYGGLAIDLMTYTPHVSWEFHFYGFVIGVLSAIKLNRAKKEYSKNIIPPKTS